MTALSLRAAAPGLIAALAALLTAAALLGAGHPPAFAGWTALFFALLAGLAWIDATTETVPDVLTLGLVAAGLAHAAAAGAELLSVAAAAGLVLVAGVLHDRLRGDRGWIGSGDFFLLAGVIAWFGPVLTLDVLAITSAGLMLHALISRRATTAVAPSLAAAAALVWLGGPIL